jgi:hypothetical protein
MRAKRFLRMRSRLGPGATRADGRLRTRKARKLGAGGIGGASIMRVARGQRATTCCGRSGHYGSCAPSAPALSYGGYDWVGLARTLALLTSAKTPKISTRSLSRTCKTRRCAWTPEGASRFGASALFSSDMAAPVGAEPGPRLTRGPHIEDHPYARASTRGVLELSDGLEATTVWNTTRTSNDSLGSSSVRGLALRT